MVLRQQGLTGWRFTFRSNPEMFCSQWRWFAYEGDKLLLWTVSKGNLVLHVGICPCLSNTDLLINLCRFCFWTSIQTSHQRSIQLTNVSNSCFMWYALVSPSIWFGSTNSGFWNGGIYPWWVNCYLHFNYTTTMENTVFWLAGGSALM